MKFSNANPDLVKTFVVVETIVDVVEAFDG